MVNFPTSLDSLANPTSTTYRDDPGFELDVVISTLNDIVEQLEAKLGTGASTAAANQVLRGTGAGATAFGAIQAGDLAADAARKKAGSAVGSTSNPTTTSASYADLAEMSVTLTTTGGDLLVWFTGVFTHSTTGITTIGFSLDGAAEVGGWLWTAPSAGYYSTVSCCYRFAAPSAAAHTVKVRWNTNAPTATAFNALRNMVVMET